MLMWLLQVEILAFLQAGGMDLVLSLSFLEKEITMEHNINIEDMEEEHTRKTELPRNEQ